MFTWLGIGLLAMFIARRIIFMREGVNPLWAILIFFGAITIFIGGSVLMSAAISPGVVLSIIGILIAFTAADLYFKRGGGARQRRIEAGYCPACGYDLRESQDQCPECGGAIPEELARWRKWQTQIAARKAATERAFQDEPKSLTPPKESP